MSKNYIFTLLFLLTSITCFSQTIAAPTNFAGVESSPGKITFTWTDNSNNETGFYIEKLISASNDWEKVCKVSSNLTSTTYTAISNNIYRISAYQGFIVNGKGVPYQSSYCQTCVGLLADLTISNITPSKTIVNPGESITISYTVNNIGTYKTLFETWVRVLVSSTSTEPGVLAGPTEYFQMVDAGLTAGTSISKSLTITTPTGNGTYYIMCIVSPLTYNHTPELSTTNNCATTAIEIASVDLTTSNVTLSQTTVDGGSTVNVSCLVKNIGGVNAPSSTLKYYISTTSTGQDQELGSYTIGELAAGASTSHSTTLTIPSSTIGGSYYIVSKANATGSIAEPISNNFASKQITIVGKPYFQVTDITWDGTQSGTNITYTVKVKNIGTQSGVVPESLIKIKSKLDTDLDELALFAQYGLINCVDFFNIGATEAIGIGETKSFSQMGSVPGVAGSSQWVIPNIKNWDNTVSYIAKKFTITSSKVIRIPQIELSKQNSLDHNTEVKVYPNPNNGEFTINLDNNKYTSVKVFNSFGQLVFCNEINNKPSLEINLFHLPSGAYMVNLINGAKVESRKVIIQK
ncbi:MAG: T9SS type A sorting domain-containing protein [Bacteroidales bacterium]|nr:T9SS type A sorting domain-containing protein [Bacteroidales bacterium]